MDGLFLLTGPNNPPMVQIAAIRELLDRLIGKSPISIDAVHTSCRSDIPTQGRCLLVRQVLGAIAPSRLRWSPLRVFLLRLCPVVSSEVGFGCLQDVAGVVHAQQQLITLAKLPWRRTRLTLTIRL
jgi:hypothetical protein